jgi:hypothetical protein
MQDSRGLQTFGSAGAGSHPTQVQATYRGDSIQVYASDLLDQLDRKQITPQQFLRAFQDRYAAGLGFGPADQAAMREYYRSQGSSYDPFSFDASPDELVAQARRGRGFVTVGRSPEVIRNLDAFRHSAFIDPMTAQVRNATSPQAELDRAIQGLMDKGIDPASVHWDGEMDPDSQLRIMATAREAWPELQRYLDARARLHPGAYQHLAMDIGSAAAGAGSRLVQSASNLGTLLFSRGEPTEPPDVIESLRQELINSGVPAALVHRDDPQDLAVFINDRPDLRELIDRYLHARFGALRFHQSELARQLDAQADDEAKAAPGPLNELVRGLAGSAFELPKYGLIGSAGPASPLLFAAEGALSQAHKGAGAAGKGAVTGLLSSAAPELGAELPTAVRAPFMASSGGAQAFIESAQPGVTPGQAVLSAIPVTIQMGALGSRGLHGAGPEVARASGEYSPLYRTGTEEARLAGNDSAFGDTRAAEKLLRVTDRYGSYPPPVSTALEAVDGPSYEEAAAKLLNPPPRTEGMLQAMRRYSGPETMLEQIRRNIFAESSPTRQSSALRRGGPRVAVTGGSYGALASPTAEPLAGPPATESAASSPPATGPQRGALSITTRADPARRTLEGSPIYRSTTGRFETASAASEFRVSEPAEESATNSAAADPARYQEISVPPIDEILKRAQGPDGSLELSLSGMRKQVVPDHRMADQGHGATDAAQKMLDSAYDAAITSSKYAGVDAFIGGTGSGKSVMSEATPLLAERRANRIIVESHAENAENLAAKLDKAREAGFPVDVHVVIRDPVQSYKSVVGRYNRADANKPGSGKVVPVNYGAATHEAVIENVPKLIGHYADDPGVRWHFIDNTGMPEQAREVGAEDVLRMLASVDTNDLRGNFNDVLDNSKLTKRDLERFRDQSLPSEFGSGPAGKNATGSAPPTTARYGDQNVVFTRDRLARAQEAVGRKLNPNRLNAGIDPTLLPNLLTIGGYHLEAGSIEFADWSARMVDHLGDWVIPLLPELYDRALKNIYWRSRRPGLEPDEAESLHAVLETLHGQASDTLVDPAENIVGVQSPWDNQPSQAGTNDVLETHAEHGGGAKSGSSVIMPGDGPAERRTDGPPGQAPIGTTAWSKAPTNIGPASGKNRSRVAGNAAVKPPFPRAEADVRGVRRFNPNVPGHVKGWKTERQLARRVHNLTDEVVVHWGGPIGSHGPDIVSINLRTGTVTLWDAKFRGRKIRVQGSSTFKPGSSPRMKAIQKALKAVNRDTTLGPRVRARARRNLQNGIFKTRTAGFGNAKNSILGR